MAQNVDDRRAYYIAHRDEILARVKARAIAKRDEIRVYKKRHAVENSKKIAGQRKLFRAANRQRLSDAKKAAYAANVGNIKEKLAAYRKANPDKVRAVVRVSLRAYRRAHPDKRAEESARRRAWKLNTKTEKVSFKQILKDSKGLCGICRKPLDLFGIHFDHIVPLARGGTHTRDNIQATHARCNLSKGTKVG